MYRLLLPPLVNPNPTGSIPRLPTGIVRHDPKHQQPGVGSAPPHVLRIGAPGVPDLSPCAATVGGNLKLVAGRSLGLVPFQVNICRDGMGCENEDDCFGEQDFSHSRSSYHPAPLSQGRVGGSSRCVANEPYFIGSIIRVSQVTASPAFTVNPVTLHIRSVVLKLKLTLVLVVTDAAPFS